MKQIRCGLSMDEVNTTSQNSSLSFGSEADFFNKLHSNGCPHNSLMNGSMLGDPTSQTPGMFRCYYCPLGETLVSLCLDFFGGTVQLSPSDY